MFTDLQSYEGLRACAHVLVEARTKSEVTAHALSEPDLEELDVVSDEEVGLQFDGLLQAV